ncbi:hypothetical protein N7454_003513 [Penicillium verhagenii]|nr:hypothetical protein N7454_003513 [Penicillium verhagenii]
MRFPRAIIASMALVVPALASKEVTQQALLKTAENAVPGESALFTTYTGKQTPLASNYTQVINATGTGVPGADDLLFQNLLSAEWVIYSFYQQAVEIFNSSSFTRLGFPNTTYERIREIRNNEAGHARIFQDNISENSLKPGPCTYSFGFGDDAMKFLALQIYIEVASQAFLTGLQLQATLNVSRSTLAALGQVEARHSTWALIENWKVSPFSGPSDTAYPYANQILDMTNSFISSCPSANPEYPSPRQNLPQMVFWANGTTAAPGSQIQPYFYQASNKPKFETGKDYYAVFYHGVNTISVPYDWKKGIVTIPKQIDVASGIIIVNIADEKDAPTEASVVAGPMAILEQPTALTTEEPDAITQ